MATLPESKDSATHPGEKIFLIQSEAADLLRLSTRTLERMRLGGTGPRYRKFGRRVAYAAADIEAWADARTFASTSEAAVA